MMATTEPENIPQTIRSRCQHFSFHAVKFEDILAQLKMIAQEEQITAEEAALALLAEAGDGSMRDALSIMDQAIASAPSESGRPVISAAQVRELMGSVPNTVFERLLEAVAQGQSAELMEQLNGLLNAGHSPLSLARQMTRYLRNTLMAKLGGEQTELLQISADERARAMRTALLFTDEELTRNLQIVLRTFDDLNYRQEQRLHLELGLLKLIHAQRLLPIEELLSGAASGSGTRRDVASSTARATSGGHRPTAATMPSVNAGSSRSTIGFGSAPEARQSAAAAPSAALENTAAAHGTALVGSASALAEPAVTAEAPAQAGPANGMSAEHLREAIVAALATAGHSSAAQLLGAGEWKIDGASVRVAAPGLGKKMLSLTVNAAAEKIIRQELQKMGAPPRFMVTPGEGVAATVPAAAIAGSVQEAALAHPMVKKAQEIFKAEVRSVVDLRQK